VEPLGRHVIRVSVRMMGPLREASGRSKEELNLTGDVDVSSAIRELVEEHGEAFKDALLDPLSQSPTTKTLILLNGVEINNIKGIDTPLDDGDHIVLIPVTHGG
jgi:molybdopterin converting factor small subunit